MENNTWSPYVGSIVLIDDHPLILTALEMVCCSYFPKYNIVKFQCAEEGLIYCASEPNVKMVVLDYSLPFMGECQAIRAFRKHDDQLPIVTFSGSEELIIAKQAIYCGSNVYVSKSIATDYMMQLLADVLSNGKVAKKINFSTAREEERAYSINLSVRQREVINLLVKGLANKEIAQCLDIAEITVKKTLSRLYEVFKVKNRGQLIIHAKQMGFADVAYNQ